MLAIEYPRNQWLCAVAPLMVTIAANKCGAMKWIFVRRRNLAKVLCSVGISGENRTHLQY